MRTKSLKVLMAALVVLAVSFGCAGAKEDGSKSPTNPGVPTPTVSTSGLSQGAKAVVAGSMFAEKIARWPKDAVLVNIGPYAIADVQEQSDRWIAAGSPYLFIPTTDPNAELSLVNEAPNHQDACGSTALEGFPSFFAGKIRVGIGVRPGCDGGLRLIIMHNLGHAMGLGHSATGIMKAQPSEFIVLPEEIEALKWSREAAIGAIVVQ